MGVTGPWHLERGLNAGTDEAVAGMIVDRPERGLVAPRAPCDRGGEAGGVPEHLLQGGQHR